MMAGDSQAAIGALDDRGRALEPGAGGRVRDEAHFLGRGLKARTAARGDLRLRDRCLREALHVLTQMVIVG